MPTAVFVFPSAAGHVNPSLPLCQGLVTLGWNVEYLGISLFKQAIEKTGATFHDRNDVCSAAGIGDVTAVIIKTFQEYDTPGAQWAMNFGSISTERLLPVYIGFLQRVAPQLVVYCPVLCQIAHFAAMSLNIPDVSLLTTAGPGYWDAAFASLGGSAAKAGLIASIKADQANAKAIDGIRSVLKMPELTLNTSEPLVNDYYTSMNIVTAVPSLADANNEDDAQFYASVGKKFEFVGPLLAETQATVAEALSGEETANLFKLVAEATASNRKVIYVSLGTAVTSDEPENGWNGTSKSAITGKQLCQSVFRAVFSELGGTSTPSPTPLLVVSLGPQPDALESIDVPDNAICLRTVPQVQLLRTAKPSLFVTHGGQNSFVESISVGSPMVVCPGFGDQVTNAARAHTRGLGVKVDRPKLSGKGDDDLVGMIAAYQAAVAASIREVLGESHQGFLSKVQTASAELEQGGGVSRALQILAEAAGNPN